MIYFVGAGSGAADLITVRGYRLLQQADLIIYAGSLVNPELLQAKKSEARVLNSATMHLEEVLRAMEQAVTKGEMVVRLHTGDPSLYGAIREQMAALDQKHIPYQVCPGVSSFAAAAAALQCEYTVPSVSQSLIITRMEGRTPVPEAESLRKLAQHRTSMVIFLSAALSRQVEQELLLGGYPPDTPCAIAYKVSWPQEKLLRCALKDLHKTMEEHNLNNFSLILVGEFLGDRYALSKLYDKHFSTAFREGE